MPSRPPVDPTSLPTHDDTRDARTPLSAAQAGSLARELTEHAATPDPLETEDFGQSIDHFRVLRLLGRGGMGQVLLARDTRLGRLVALKLIREDRLDDDRVSAMMAEARVTARLSHPNIVTIHHIGRWGMSPYLALEYVAGTTLRARMNFDPPTPREAQRIALSIARALEAAHAARVTHCDLKPENVLLPPDGRLRVVDFGISRVMESLTQDVPTEGGPRVAGTPGYMAPEQWRGEAPTWSADIWALGVILYEMLAGQRPFEGPGSDSRPLFARVLDPTLAPRAVPGADGVVQRLLVAMLTRDATQRPNAATVAQQLERLLARVDPDSRSADAPFRGLLAFEERHAAFFFGRDAEVDAGVERLRTATVVPIVGQSGAGKSSYVQAGILPRLREHAPWTVVSLRPGARPLTALAGRLLTHDTNDTSRLLAQRDAVDDLAARLLENPSLANVQLHALADQVRTKVLLFVDQLEEVVTHGCSAAEAHAFLEAIAGGADSVDELVRVVFTLRDDFLGRVAIGGAMTAALANVLVVRRLDDSHLREAALRPLERMGYSWDDASVIDRIVAELSGMQAALPLLQFACAALWERRDPSTNLLRRADYEALGGVAGALASHAEAVFEGLSPADLDLARRLLLRLVAPDGARRTLLRAAALEGLGDRGVAVLERLTNARLLTVRRTRDGTQDDALLELAHDSLLHTWPQLTRWLEESSEERAAVAEIEATAALWVSRGCRREEVWPLDAVRDAKARLRREAGALSPGATAFLTTGESIGLRRQRRNRLLALGGAGIGLCITIGSLMVAAELAQRERTTREQASQIALAAGDTGLVRFEVELIDRDPRGLGAVKVDAGQFPHFAVTLLDIDLNDPRKAAAPRDRRFVRMSAPTLREGRWTAELETRSGPVFLRIDGRGRTGEHCPPSYLRLRGLPGYGARAGGAQPVRLTVPSCSASDVDMVLVPAGPFYFGGVGDPPIAGHLAPSPEALVDLPAFRIDRTEVANSWFAVYARAEPFTGDGVPDYPPDDIVRDAAKADHPVTAIDAYAADAFCAWQGKRLPTSEQWTKAARGGLHLDAAGTQANPLPHRNLPWGREEPAARMNLRDTQDAWGHSAPVGALPQGASPYGILALADNVAEWTSTVPQTARPGALRIIRGGDWSVEVADGAHAISVENARSPRFFYFGLGVRCVSDAQ